VCILFLAFLWLGRQGWVDEGGLKIRGLMMMMMMMMSIASVYERELRVVVKRIEV